MTERGTGNTIYPGHFVAEAWKTTALSVKYHIKNDITNIKMPLSMGSRFNINLFK